MMINWTRIHPHYRPDAEYRDYFQASVLTIETRQTLGEGEAMGYVLRKTP